MSQKIAKILTSIAQNALDVSKLIAERRGIEHPSAEIHRNVQQQKQKALKQNTLTNSKIRSL